MMGPAHPIETAPKDRRILAFGLIAFENVPSWGTVKWHPTYSQWYGDPCEATEYDPELCKLTHWMELPPDPSNINIVS